MSFTIARRPHSSPNTLGPVGSVCSRFNDDMSISGVERRSTRGVICALAIAPRASPSSKERVPRGPVPFPLPRSGHRPACYYRPCHCPYPVSGWGRLVVRRPSPPPRLPSPRTAYGRRGGLVVPLMPCALVCFVTPRPVFRMPPGACRRLRFATPSPARDSPTTMQCATHRSPLRHARRSVSLFSTSSYATPSESATICACKNQNPADLGLPTRIPRLLLGA